MSKILKCPICGKKKPVRNDAKVCSGKCRVKKWRAALSKGQSEEIGTSNEQRKSDTRKST